MKFVRIFFAVLGLWFVAASPYPLSPEVDCGAIGDGLADDYPALQLCFNSGKVVRLTPGKTYRVVINWLTTPDLGLVLKAGTTVITSGASINLEIAGNAYGIRPQNNTHLVGNGTIGTSVVTFSDSAQTIYQAVISLGAAYGDVLDPANVGPFLNASGWSIEGVTLWTAKPNGFVIAAVGGVSNGHIADVTFPDSANPIGVINFDWGTVGSYTSVPDARSKWPATYYSVHPSNIVIERVHIGDMSNPASMPIRFSAVDHFTLRDWRIKGSRLAGVAHGGGDNAYEFALPDSGMSPGSQSRRAYLGTVISNGVIEKAHGGSAITIDSYGDNVFRQAGYVPLIYPIYHTDIVIENVHAEGDFSNVHDGVTVQYANGVTLRNIDMVGFKNGVRFGDYASNSSLQKSRIWGNMGDGVLVAGSASPPTDTAITDNIVANNGSGVTNAAIRILNGARPFIQHNILGGAGEGGQYYGISIDLSVVDAFVFSNYVKAIKSGGAGIAKGSTAQIAWNFFDASIPVARQIIN